MNITIVLPWYDYNLPSGGILNMYGYAERLACKGHKITILYDCGKGKGKLKIPNIITYNKRRKKTISKKKLYKKKNITEIAVYSINDKTVPDGDFVIATALITVGGVNGLSKCKGKKVYFIQGFENWGISDREVYKTYELGMINIAVSSWLCSIFVTASWLEGFGLTAAESMKCGCCLVTTDSKGIRDFSFDCKTALEQIDEELKQERMTILEEYYTLIQQRYENRERTVSSWNEAGNLRITLLPMGNMEKNEEVFRNIINKQGTTFSSDILERNKEEEYSGGIVFRLANPENGNYLENYKAMCEELTNRNSSTYGKKFRAHLNNLFENDYSVENEIYMWLPEDLVRLELKTGRNKYISIDAGSAGQRTSAILTLLLQMSKEPIIIDQPEDDLDTKNITDFIVKGINEKKQSQQIIVVTHNPNIVVNTNSEQVIHMEFAGGEINASHSGALQDFEIRDAICDVMEGGREALESRYYRITKALE